MNFFLFCLFFISTAHAYTFNNNFNAAFENNKIKVFIDGETVCSVVQLTVNELESMVSPAVDKFWNKISSSSLKLDASGFSDPIANINQGRLCSPTDDACIADGSNDVNGLIPPVKDIIIACNDNPLNFGGNEVLAVTVPNNFNGKKISGAVILINEQSTFGALSRADQIAVLSHEIGHAIGLGHSEDRSALMYYRTVKLRKRLGQDDIDGVSYLYPMHADAGGLLEGGLLGGCGTISLDKDPPSDPPYTQMMVAFGIMIILFELYQLFTQGPKTRSTF